MALPTGTRLGVYEITSALGAGGMGEVYRARDIKLNRDVALKLLPQGFKDDPTRLARFEREAQVLAALNHPNIAHIHGLEESSGSPALVMELVEGDTLAEKLQQLSTFKAQGSTLTAIPQPPGTSPQPPGGGLRLADVLDIARQLADALDAAHARGIIHRDLKPANIKITPAGLVKVLDFGLAKELRVADPALDSAAMTIEGEHTLTMFGSVVGTVAYMSPEQARGEPLDARTDLFSLGAVLYEVSTGRRAFPGTVSTVIIDAILHQTPPSPRTLNPGIAPGFERIIQRLLEKDRSVRYEHASDVRADLVRLQQEIELSRADVGMRRRYRRQLVAAAAVIVAVAGAGAWLWPRAMPPAPGAAVYEQVTFFADSATSPSLSPDGRLLTFIQGNDPFFGAGQVYIKSLPAGEPVQLTHDSLRKMAPAFSPDASRVAYTVVVPPSKWDTWTVSALGGEPQLWMGNAGALTWMAGKRIVFSEILRGIHMRVVTGSESRDDLRAVYTPGQEQGMAHWSHPSPDGRSVAVVEMQRGVWLPCRVVPFDGSSEGRRVAPDGQCTSVAWSPDGRWIYYSSNGGGAFHIWRAPAAGGAPEQITTGLTEEEGIAVAPDGRSLFTSIGSRQRALWMHDGKGDRAVSTEGFAFVPTLPSSLVQPFSADGTKVLYLVRRGAGRVSGATERDGELRMTDLVTGHSEALMPGFNVVGYDVSRDMQQIVFAALDEKGASHLWLSRLDRQLPPRRLSSIEADNPRFGANGEVFCNSVEAASGRAFIYRIPPDGGEPRKAVDAPVQFFNSVSNDSAWLLYSVPTDAGTRSQVVAHAIASGETIPVCSGCQVDWTTDGKALVLWMRPADSSPLQTIVLANEPGRMLPRLPATGVTSKADLDALSVLSTTDALVFPLGTTGQYVTARETIQRNVYRVPLR